MVLKKWKLLEHKQYESSLQWCLRVNLKPGNYLLVYESKMELKYDLKYCFRIFKDER